MIKFATANAYTMCFNAGVQALDGSLPDLSFMLAKHLV
jgi:hypothetical protein